MSSAQGSTWHSKGTVHVDFVACLCPHMHVCSGEFGVPWAYALCMLHVRSFACAKYMCDLTCMCVCTSHGHVGEHRGGDPGAVELHAPCMCGRARLVLACGLGTHRARRTRVCFRAVCERARRQEPVLCVHVLSVCEPPPLAAVQAPLPSLPVSWEPWDPEGGKLLLADVAKMDWIYLD